jgi:hypothetical protein
LVDHAMLAHDINSLTKAALQARGTET